jgi:hypothetical protein
MIWHNKVDLIMEHNKMKHAYASGRAVRGRGRVRTEVNKCTSSEDDDNEGETDEDEKMSGHNGDTQEDKDEKMSGHNGNTQDQEMPSDDKEDNSDDNSNAKLNRNITLQRIRNYSLRSDAASGPFDVASMANLSFLRKEIEDNRNRGEESGGTTDTEQ